MFIVISYVRGFLIEIPKLSICQVSYSYILFSSVSFLILCLVVNCKK